MSWQTDTQVDRQTESRALCTANEKEMNGTLIDGERICQTAATILPLNPMIYLCLCGRLRDQLLGPLMATGCVIISS